MPTTLSLAVEHFARVTHALSDADLARPWAWHAYSIDGLRFAFLRSCEELRELAVLMATERAARGPGVTPGQRIMGQYHGGYRDLQALLVGVESEMLDSVPAEGEWPLRAVLAHIVETELRYLAVTMYALDRHRRGEQAVAMPPKGWPEIVGLDDDAWAKAMRGSLADILVCYDALHERVLGEFTGLGEEELAAASLYWEGEELSVRFRLHRFESHVRQHTVQVAKTLDRLGRRPSEAHQLLRLLYAALAEAEGAALGADQLLTEQQRQVAPLISTRAKEIAGILA